MPDRSEALRKAYAARILGLAGVEDAKLEAAFAAVPTRVVIGLDQLRSSRREIRHWPADRPTRSAGVATPGPPCLRSKGGLADGIGHQ